MIANKKQKELIEEYRIKDLAMITRDNNTYDLEDWRNGRFLNYINKLHGTETVTVVERARASQNLMRYYHQGCVSISVLKQINEEQTRIYNTYLDQLFQKQKLMIRGEYQNAEFPQKLYRAKLQQLKERVESHEEPEKIYAGLKKVSFIVPHDMIEVDRGEIILIPDGCFLPLFFLKLQVWLENASEDDLKMKKRRRPDKEKTGPYKDRNTRDLYLKNWVKSLVNEGHNLTSAFNIVGAESEWSKSTAERAYKREDI